MPGSANIAFSATGLLSAAVQVGDRERAAAALAVLHAGELSSDDLATAGAGEHLVSQALLEVQRACPDSALDLLREVRRAAGERGEVGYTGAVTALALAAAGRVDDALAALLARAEETDDRVAQALVLLGWALALDAVGAASAATRRASASARFGELGLDPGGWAVALGQAVGLAPQRS